MESSVKYQTFTKNILLSATIFGMSQTASAVTDEEFRTLQDQFNQLAEHVEDNSSGASDTTIGGYGELHYNNLDGKDNALDLHRFVLFVNHEFNEDVRFFSEFEIEHGLVKDTDDGTNGGEVEVEQAYIQIDLDNNKQVNAGVFLIPVGIMNETHEPPTFYGVERNPVEKNIIPATWWEGGAMLSGQYSSGLSYDLAISTGLNGGTSIRGGRQKTAKAAAESLATTLRVKYTGISGLELAGTVQKQNDMTQEKGDGVEGATLIEAHARWNKDDLTVTGLYASWNIDGSAADTTEKDKQDGGYLEVSYKISPSVGVFARQNEWNNGGTGDTKKSQIDFGVNYYPHEDVVIKADFQSQNDVAGNADGFNLGLGYQF